MFILDILHYLTVLIIFITITIFFMIFNYRSGGNIVLAALFTTSEICQVRPSLNAQCSCFAFSVFMILIS